MTVVFVGSAVSEPSDSLGFYHLHPRDRFWEMLELASITPKRIISPEERKALAEGHSHGSLSEPVRVLFTQKKTGQLMQLGVGLTDLNRRMVASNDKDKLARPTEDDVREFIARAEKLTPRVLGFVCSTEIFVESFKGRYPGITGALGLQAFNVGSSEVWLLGSTGGLVRGEALARQEDAFFELGERIQSLRREMPKG